MNSRPATQTGGPDLRLQPLPSLSPLDRDAAAEEIAEIAASAAEAELPRLAALLSGKGKQRDFLAAVFDLSPFLRDCVRRRPEILDALFDNTVAERLDAILSDIGAAARAEDASESGVMKALRRLKL